MRFGGLVCLVGFVCLVGTTAFGESSSSSSGSSDKLSDVIKANNDYRRSLTEARLAEAKIQLDKADAQLKYAQANKEYAQAEYFRVRSQHLRDYINIMNAEYARVMREEANLKERMYQVRVHYDMCGELADGSTRRGAFQCLSYFRRYIVSFALQKKFLFDEKIEALPASEFVPNYPDLRAVPFPGGNFGQLLVFAETKDLSFTPFGRAHSFVMNFMEAVQQAAQSKIMEYRNWIDGIRAGTLDVFRMPNQ